jgi:hypothetical protein
MACSGATPRWRVLLQIGDTESPQLTLPELGTPGKLVTFLHVLSPFAAGGDNPLCHAQKRASVGRS